jgi:arabinose-5-phosphate isomerase
MIHAARSVAQPEQKASAGSEILEAGRRVLRLEAAAVAALEQRLDGSFVAAVETILASGGRVIVSGVGKSGIVARKIAATLTSTGTAATFLHPVEALHGDLGIVGPDDVAVLISKSGETEELRGLMEFFGRTGVRVVAITGRADSTLARHSTVVLLSDVGEEACPHDLAPTTSTTAALALGDALAMTLLVAKGFRQEDFANLHPGGKLGKQLMRAEQLMHGGTDTPVVRVDTPMPDVIYEMSRKGLGMTCVVDGDERLIGIITDGDLRRHMARVGNILERQARDVMTMHPVTIASSTLAAEALHVLEQRKITAVVVTTPDQRIEGVVHLHDLWRTELI